MNTYLGRYLIHVFYEAIFNNDNLWFVLSLGIALSFLFLVCLLLSLSSAVGTAIAIRGTLAISDKPLPCAMRSIHFYHNSPGQGHRRSYHICSIWPLKAQGVHQFLSS